MRMNTHQKQRYESRNRRITELGELGKTYGDISQAIRKEYGVTLSTARIQQIVMRVRP